MAGGNQHFPIGSFCAPSSSEREMQLLQDLSQLLRCLPLSRGKPVLNNPEDDIGEQNTLILQQRSLTNPVGDLQATVPLHGITDDSLNLGGSMVREQAREQIPLPIEQGEELLQKFPIIPLLRACMSRISSLSSLWYCSTRSILS